MVDCGIKYVSIDAVNKKIRILFQMKKELARGEKRKGPGRPDEGKAPFTVTLTAKNVAKAKKRERNFSGLLDRLLADFLA